MKQLEQLELIPPTAAEQAAVAESRQTRKNAPRNAPGGLAVAMGGASATLTGADFDALERECGPCEDENGVSLWWLLRRIKANGAKRVQFI